MTNYPRPAQAQPAKPRGVCQKNMNIDDTMLNFWYFVIGGCFSLGFFHELRKFLVKRYEFQFYLMQFQNPKKEIIQIGDDNAPD